MSSAISLSVASACGNIGDFFGVAGHPVPFHPPEPRLAVVVRDEEWSKRVSGVALALAIVFPVNRDVVRLAFGDDERRFLISLILHGAPNDDVGFDRTASVFRGNFFVHLIKRKAIVVHELADKLLAHDLFGILNEPVLADVAPDFPFAVTAKGQ